MRPYRYTEQGVEKTTQSDHLDWETILFMDLGDSSLTKHCSLSNVAHAAYCVLFFSDVVLLTVSPSKQESRQTNFAEIVRRRGVGFAKVHLAPSLSFTSRVLVPAKEGHGEGRKGPLVVSVMSSK